MSRRILVLDGAMGTMIQRYKLSEEDYRGQRFADFSVPGKDVFVKGNNELLTLTQPHIIQEIHEQYLAAGADLIETNTFGATSIAQDDYHMAHLVREMNLEAARIALTRNMKREGKVWIRVFPDKPITSKPAEVRMGKGKGAVDHYVCEVQPGRIIFEVEGVPADVAIRSLELAAQKLPILCKAVTRYDYEG